MRCKAPDKRFFAELTDLNTEFLALLTRATDFPGGGLFGVDSAIMLQMQSLSLRQRAFIAGAPTLLAGFSSLPPGSVIEDGSPPASGIPTDSQVSAVTFSAGLMTYLWQMARRDSLTAALCVGVASQDVERLAALSFGDIQSSTRWAARRLQARFSDHPRFWPDLIRAARRGEGAVQRVYRLSGIPLSFAGQRPTTDPHRKSLIHKWS
jgi:hypothetical protein